jgi:hypothetical protein
MGSLFKIGVCQDQTNFLKTISYIWTAIILSTNLHFFNPNRCLNHVRPQYGKHTSYRVDRLHCRDHRHWHMVWSWIEDTTRTKPGKA